MAKLRDLIEKVETLKKTNEMLSSRIDPAESKIDIPFMDAVFIANVLEEYCEVLLSANIELSSDS